MTAERPTTTQMISIKAFGRVAPMVLCLALAGGSGALGQEGESKLGWVSLFNGKDLDGWTPKIKGYEAGENYGNTFRVEDGVLKVSYDQYPDVRRQVRPPLLRSRRISSYRLRIEYRFVGEQCPGGPAWALRNSGVMIHGQSPESMRKDQDFPVSIEVQFLGGDGRKERPTGNVCTPGTNIVMDGKLITTALHQLAVEDLSRRPVGHGRRWRSTATARSSTSSTARPCSNTRSRSSTRRTRTPAS